MTRNVREEGLAAWRAFVTAHPRVLAKLEAEMVAERGLPLVWYEVLLHLSEAPGQSLRMQDLADRMLLTQSGVSRVVDRMEDAQLLKRTSSSSDGRVRNAVLTAKGRREQREAARVHLRGIEEHFLQHMSIEELRVLKRAFARVVEAAAEQTRLRTPVRA